MNPRFNDYPKVMRHPESKPAVVEKGGDPAIDGMFAAQPCQLRPAMYPDVTVKNLNSEKEYAAKGYRPVHMGNAAEYENTILEGSVHVDGAKTDFPKWKDQDEEMPVIVNDATEEKALGKGWRDTRLPVEASEVPQSHVPPAKVDGRSKAARAARK
jgi:hypothetical protein